MSTDADLGCFCPLNTTGECLKKGVMDIQRCTGDENLNLNKRNRSRSDQNYHVRSFFDRRSFNHLLATLLFMRCRIFECGNRI